jgi:hypothetical protein
MTAAILVPYAILGIDFLKENNVVINLTEWSFKTRRDGWNCERKFFYDSMPNNKVGVRLIPNQKFQMNFSESQRQPDGKDYIVGAQTREVQPPV